jgi:leucyl-tRNA synthetase
MYNYKEFEKKWQTKWKEENIGLAERDEKKEKFFLIWAYLTVSGFHHVGHMRGYSYADSICRYKRMNGFNVLLAAGGHSSGNGAVSKALKVREKDKETIDYYTEKGLSEKDLEKISTPEGFVDFFSEMYVKDYDSYGFLGDFRRFTVTTYPDYQKFIEWQFKKLKEKELLVQKPYFATACVKCGPVAVDPSEMDLSKGGNAEKQEFTIIKLNFEKENQFILIATLRPETIYGQTNIWISPEDEYVKIKYGDEIWIASIDFYEKIKYQIDDVILLDEKIKGKELLGRVVKPPIIDREIIILPSSFCDLKIGTGIVTSVPSDAPVDWMGLYDLQSSKEECEKYNLDHDTIKNIKLISIIKSKDFNDFPAVEICEKMNISSQKDLEKLEDAKKEVYKKGYHTGVMNENCQEFAGLKVEVAKERIKEKMIENNQAFNFYSLSEEVLCRCSSPVVIKRIDDQWFIKYSNKELTSKTIEHVKEMKILPESFKKNLPNILNWFDDRACARQGTWLGTKLPFDQSYIVEPISDSTLYPIYYLVSLYINQGKIKVEQLTEDFFDYVFLGVGNSIEISKKISIDIDLLENIRKDVVYWYPLDINLGGKEHQTVHFPTFLMNHVGVFNKDFYPKGIFVNWWVTGSSGKISKSKGGVGSIGLEAEKYSIDAIRFFYANIASPFVDISFQEDDLKTYKQRLERLFLFIENIINNSYDLDVKEDSEVKETELDRWFESKFNLRLKNIIDAMDEIEFKQATDEIYFNFYNDFSWYLKRGGNNSLLIKSILNKWVLTMGIFTPHLAEELNCLIGNNQLVIKQKFPLVDIEKINLSLDDKEKNVEKIISDLRNVIKLSGFEKINKITLFVSLPWKYLFYQELLDDLITSRNVGQLVSKYISKYPEEKQEVSKTINRLIKQSILKENLRFLEEDYNFLLSIKDFVSSTFDCNVSIIKAEESTHEKAKQATPDRFGFLVE